MQKSSIDEEINKFSAMATEWWKKDGKFKILHAFNHTRMVFIEQCLSSYGQALANPAEVSILDIGCGGGILSEALAKKGYNVTGLDASEPSIVQAKAHAIEQQLNIEYLLATPEEHLQSSKQYNAVFAMEIIEHVADPKEFVNYIKHFIKPGGLLFFSTINRNLKSLVLAKFTAEYILGWLPKKTHDFSKFITPQELTVLVEDILVEGTGNKAHNFSQVNLPCYLQEIKGINFNIINKTWNLSSQPTVNYICCFKKNKI
ncbi:Ubiquinone biosynthesis O-methyltransferase [Candidatus Hepatincolaceae symbiont of Richtersius coronifer]